MCVCVELGKENRNQNGSMALVGLGWAGSASVGVTEDLEIS